MAADYEGQRKLINYGLRETARQARPPAAEDADDQVGRWVGIGRCRGAAVQRL